jgi:hypothetical protein
LLHNNAKDSIQINPFHVNFYPHFKSFADVFATTSLKVNDAALTVYKNRKKTLQERITFDLTNFRIEDQPSKGFLHAEDFSFNIQDIIKEDAKKLYQFTVGQTEYSSKDDRFTARDLKVVPNLTKEKFNERNGFQTDYFNGEIESLEITHPNIERWFEKGELAGRNMSVIGLDFDIYRDKRLPFDEKRRPKMLQDMIKELPYPIRVDSLNLVDAKIRYTEQPPLGDAMGVVKFTNLYVCLNGLSGSMSIDIRDGGHFYTFEYSLAVEPADD